MPSLFTVNPEGGIEYQPTEEELQQLEEQQPEENTEDLAESEGLTDGQDIGGDLSSGDGLLSPEDGVENKSEVSEESPVPLDLPYSDDGRLAVSLPDEVTSALLSTSPASGALGSGTLDYFDRVVGGIDSDCAYVGYRTNSDDSYSGFLIWSDSYDVNGSVISFRNAETVEVWRDGSYDRLTRYERSSGVGMDISIPGNTTTVYYTNVIEGYPVLGDVERPFSISPFLIVGLLTAAAAVVLNKLMGGR